MIKTKFIATTDAGITYYTYALDLEDAIQRFHQNNIHGKCKEIGTDHWITI
jgi:hypothetical protein